MIRSLVVFPEAEEEATEAASWYERQQTGLGLEWLTELDGVFDRIAENALQFPKWQPDPRFRRATMSRFPYVVFFKLRGEVIHVVAIAHGRRKPGYWRHRVDPS